MKRFGPALLLAGAIACSGGGDSNDLVKPPSGDPPPFEVVSGSFTVTARSTVNGCDRTTDWNGTYDIQIDSTTFMMGTWKGNWSPTTVMGVAESEREKITTRNCTITNWVTAYVTFTSEDAFSGTISYRHRLARDCPNLTTCTSTWIITGTRVALPASETR
jgi:hypothetical protein